MRLFGPESRGWFRACHIWVHEGLSPESDPGVPSLLAALSPRVGRAMDDFERQPQRDEIIGADGKQDSGECKQQEPVNNQSIAFPAGHVDDGDRGQQAERDDNPMFASHQPIVDECQTVTVR